MLNALQGFFFLTGFDIQGHFFLEAAKITFYDFLNPLVPVNGGSHFLGIPDTGDLKRVAQIGCMMDIVMDILNLDILNGKGFYRVRGHFK